MSLQLKFLFLALMVFVSSMARADGGESSEDLRKDKKFMVVAQPFGWGPGDAVTQGLAVGYFISGNALVILEYMNHLPVVSYGDVSAGHQRSRSGNSYGAHFKYFVLNSFYTKAGIDRIQDHYSDSGYNATPGCETSSSGCSDTATSLSVAIGNQWQWSPFTMGADWFGYVIPLSSSGTSRITTTEFQALRFYLGFSF